MMVILSPLSFNSTGGWHNGQPFEQHPLYEFEEEVFVFNLFVLVLLFARSSQPITAWQPVYFIIPSLQLRPPK
jgi:hypothetical protein